MNHVFSQVPRLNIPRSMFKRPFNLKTTMDVNYLVPIYCDEVLPGDTFKFKQHLFGRLSTPVVPLMDNLYLDTFYFAVPIRLIDDNWQKFMGERPFGDTTTQYLTPVLNTGTGVAVESLSDYIGIPTGVPNLDFVPYWHRAYNLIYNEWFRDELLCEPRPVAGKHYDGTVTTESLSDYVLCKRGKRHDYFTSCLPTPQRGDPVTVGIGSTAPVYGDGNVLSLTNGASTYPRYGLYGTNSSTSWQTINIGVGDVPVDTSGRTTSAPNTGAYGVTTKAGIAYKNATSAGLVADLSDATSITINALREAFAIQSLLERDNTSGTRYIELIRGHFGVTSPDARMQRPEYLGGSSRPLQVTTVPQTSASEENNTPQGNLSAFVTVRSDGYWSKSFTEHCVILGLANVRADLSYQQGLPRMFSRRTRYDFYWPELANLGEQAVLNKEIFAQGSGVKDGSLIIDEQPFGYQERWAEYRYHPNMITGKFRSQAAQSLDVWHLAQEFSSLPTLSSDFIEENVPIDRVVAVTDEPPLILDGWFEVECARPMPLYSVPGIGRRF